MYPMGREIWNPTICMSLEVLLEMRKATDRKSSILTHNLM